jgi:hypothetical protein
MTMASESEIRAKAKESGLNQQQEDKAVQFGKDNPNADVNQVIEQARQ